MNESERYRNTETHRHAQKHTRTCAARYPPCPSYIPYKLQSELLLLLVEEVVVVLAVASLPSVSLPTSVARPLLLLPPLPPLLLLLLLLSLTPPFPPPPPPPSSACLSSWYGRLPTSEWRRGRGRG